MEHDSTIKITREGGVMVSGSSAKAGDTFTVGKNVRFSTAHIMVKRGWAEIITEKAKPKAKKKAKAKK